MGFLFLLLSFDYPWKGKDDPYFFPTSTSWWSVPLSFCSLADALCKMAFHKLMTFADFQEEIRYSWRRGKRIGGRGSSQHRALMHIGCWCGCQRNQHTHRARTHNHEDDEGGSAIIIYLLISSLREILCAVINCKPIKRNLTAATHTPRDMTGNSLQTFRKINWRFGYLLIIRIYSFN